MTLVRRKQAPVLGIRWNLTNYEVKKVSIDLGESELNSVAICRTALTLVYVVMPS